MPRIPVVDAPGESPQATRAPFLQDGGERTIAATGEAIGGALSQASEALAGYAQRARKQARDTQFLEARNELAAKKFDLLRGSNGVLTKRGTEAQAWLGQASSEFDRWAESRAGQFREPEDRNEFLARYVEPTKMDFLLEGTRHAQAEGQARLKEAWETAGAGMASETVGLAESLARLAPGDFDRGFSAVPRMLARRQDELRENGGSVFADDGALDRAVEERRSNALAQGAATLLKMDRTPQAKQWYELTKDVMLPEDRAQVEASLRPAVERDNALKASARDFEDFGPWFTAADLARIDASINAETDPDTKEIRENDRTRRVNQAREQRNALQDEMFTADWQALEKHKDIGLIKQGPNWLKYEPRQQEDLEQRARALLTGEPRVTNWGWVHDNLDTVPDGRGGRRLLTAEEEAEQNLLPAWGWMEPGDWYARLNRQESIKSAIAKGQQPKIIRGASTISQEVEHAVTLWKGTELSKEQKSELEHAARDRVGETWKRLGREELTSEEQKQIVSDLTRSVTVYKGKNKILPSGLFFQTETVLKAPNAEGKLRDYGQVYATEIPSWDEPIVREWVRSRKDNFTQDDIRQAYGEYLVGLNDDLADALEGGNAVQAIPSDVAPAPGYDPPAHLVDQVDAAIAVRSEQRVREGKSPLPVGDPATRRAFWTAIQEALAEELRQTAAPGPTVEPAPVGPVYGPEDGPPPVGAVGASAREVGEVLGWAARGIGEGLAEAGRGIVRLPIFGSTGVKRGPVSPLTEEEAASLRAERLVRKTTEPEP